MRRSRKKFRLSRKDLIEIIVLSILVVVATYVAVHYVFYKTAFWKAVVIFLK